MNYDDCYPQQDRARRFRDALDFAQLSASDVEERRAARTCIVCLVVHERPLEDYVCDDCRANEQEADRAA
jgi:hypothetical protein